MAKKEFSYRGKTLEELQKMDLKEFASLLTSRERRKVSRGFRDAEKKLLEKIDKFKAGATKKPVKTHCRAMVVLPIMVGMKIQIHNGKAFVPIDIMPEMIGHRLGEFAMTRVKVAHSAPGIGATKSSASMSVK